MSQNGQNTFAHAPWLVIAILLLVVSGLIYQTDLMDHEADVTSNQKNHLKEVSIEIKALRANWQSEIDDLKAIERGLEKGTESYRLTRLLTSTFSGFINDANYLEKGLKSVKDTVGYYFMVNELADIKSAWKGSKRLLQEHKGLLATFSKISDYKIKVDSLRQFLSNANNKSLFTQKELRLAQRQITGYEKKINQLSNEAQSGAQQNDSLSKVIKLQSGKIDSLSYSLLAQREAYQKVKKEALQNARLANRLNLWYHEKTSKNKVKRRMLTQNKVDFNKGIDLKSIYAEFSLSADLYKPNQVSEVILYNITDGSRVQTASVQVSVRDQKSGEFSIIPNRKLVKGHYKVEVEYADSIVLSQDFYVSK
ncbi:MAG: hypothetical protein ACPGLV_01225 [Bacteroidia bacterium]